MKNITIRDRETILTEVLDLQREIDDLHEQINELCEEAKKTVDPEDDESEKKFRMSHIRSILSHEIIL